MFNLLYITWSASPEAFTIPFIDWPVRWYGLLFVGGLIASQYVMFYLFKVEGKPKKDVEDLTIYIVLGTILGARLGHVFFYEPAYYLQHPAEILAVWQGGLASHGGAIGIIVAMWLFCRKYKYGFLWLFDRLVIVVCITGAAIRTGNLMNSEIIGRATDVPWAFIFTSVDPIPRHPSQLYEAIFCVILGLVLYGLWKSKRLTMGDGYLFGIFLIALFVQRFLGEFLKENQVAFEDAMALNMGQILSIPFVIGGVIILLRSFRQQPPQTAVKKSALK